MPLAYRGCFRPTPVILNVSQVQAIRHFSYHTLLFSGFLMENAAQLATASNDFGSSAGDSEVLDVSYHLFFILEKINFGV